MKYTGAANYEQPMHRDHNHSLLPPRMEPGWAHMEGFLYLSDVDEGSAPTRLVRVSAAEGGEGWPDPAPPEAAPALYRNEVSAVGPRGSHLAYRPDVWHRASDFTNPDGARFVLAVGFKPPGQDWIGYSPIQRSAPNHDFKQFVAASSPDELSVLGIPDPGHPFWTEVMVSAFARMYPGLDVAPWRRALT